MKFGSAKRTAALVIIFLMSSAPIYISINRNDFGISASMALLPSVISLFFVWCGEKLLQTFKMNKLSYFEFPIMIALNLILLATWRIGDGEIAYLVIHFAILVTFCKILKIDDRWGS